ncbi:hypothetical protein [Akkermansia sp.]|uniref:hypothetical protein n=1 Tax=Akkermansia sp. TaxID=1872421 RepID=UPI0025B805C9|nr:hypothetical protein [Akkermansia sp.]MCC8148069.1 hypothetical protein [Akkermansia sp.]
MKKPSAILLCIGIGTGSLWASSSQHPSVSSKENCITSCIQNGKLILSPLQERKDYTLDCINYFIKKNNLPVKSQVPLVRFMISHQDPLSKNSHSIFAIIMELNPQERKIISDKIKKQDTGIRTDTKASSRYLAKVISNTLILMYGKIEDESIMRKTMDIIPDYIKTD